MSFIIIYLADGIPMPHEKTTTIFYYFLLFGVIIVIKICLLHTSKATTASAITSAYDDSNGSNNEEIVPMMEEFSSSTTTTINKDGTSSSGNNNNTTSNNINSNNNIPFILIQEPYKITVSKLLHNAVEQYQKEIYQTLQSMSRLLEQTLSLEEAAQQTNNIPPPQKDVLMSTKIQYRIEKMSKCFEHNTQIMEQLLLHDFPYIMTLPDSNNIRSSSSSTSSSSTHHQPNHNSPPTDTATTISSSSSTLFHIVNFDKKGNKITPNTILDNNINDNDHQQALSSVANNAYDSPSQIVAHLVRDWTKLGTNIRNNLYGWCRQQLHEYVKKCKPPSMPPKMVLVPGAGMGRLSYDIWKDGYTVEANELSLIMAAATHWILLQQCKIRRRRRKKSTNIIYPFVMDVMANEVVSERRYDSIDFPDIDNDDDDENVDDVSSMPSSTKNNDSSNKDRNSNSFSFTIGNFVGEYYFSQSNVYDAIVTCFFIDTATNLYDYITLISTLLKRNGGVWINVGPVQWHGNAIIRPSVDELYDLLTKGKFGGFTIQHWSVDTKPIPYRQDEEDNFVRSTDFASYRPLRFVAIRN